MAQLTSLSINEQLVFSSPSRRSATGGGALSPFTAAIDPCWRDTPAQLICVPSVSCHRLNPVYPARRVPSRRTKVQRLYGVPRSCSESPRCGAVSDRDDTAAAGAGQGRARHRARHSERAWSRVDVRSFVELAHHPINDRRRRDVICHVTAGPVTSLVLHQVHSCMTVNFLLVPSLRTQPSGDQQRQQQKHRYYHHDDSILSLQRV